MRSGKPFARAKNYGLKRLFVTYETAIVIITYSLLVYFNYVPGAITSSLVKSGIAVSTSLSAFILAGLAIVVSASDPEYIKFLKRDDVSAFDSFIFIFEWNVYIALLTSMVGILALMDISVYAIYFFMAMFLYLIISVLRLVSTISFYGQRMGDFIVIQSESQDIDEDQ